MFIQRWPNWLRPVMVGVTIVGGPFFTLSFGTLITVIGWEANERLFYAGLLVLGVSFIGSLLKLILRRARPTTDYANAMFFKTFSFPSGHATGSAVTYGTVAYLLFFVVLAPWNYWVVGLLAILVFLVGISRVYLGAHYPSDVVAGWIMGLMGLLFVMIFIHPRVL